MVAAVGSRYPIEAAALNSPHPHNAPSSTKFLEMVARQGGLAAAKACCIHPACRMDSQNCGSAGGWILRWNSYWCSRHGTASLPRLRIPVKWGAGTATDSVGPRGGGGAGSIQQLPDEWLSHLLRMADRTEALWENVDPSASLNHGSASHAVVTL